MLVLDGVKCLFLKILCTFMIYKEITVFARHTDGHTLSLSNGMKLRSERSSGSTHRITSPRSSTGDRGMPALRQHQVDRMALLVGLYVCIGWGRHGRLSIRNWAGSSKR